MTGILALNDSQVITIVVQMLMVTAKVSAPILITAMVIGFVTSLIQSVTQLQDATLAFVPKLIGVALVIVMAGTWMLHELVTYSQQLFAMIPSLLN